jgi:tRNA pseudouridine38-40 synthase
VQEFRLNTYKAILEYNGRHYFGWQIQNDVRTIQGDLVQALKKINKNGDVRVIGASRTDRGVHALGQVCRIEQSIDMDPNALKAALNSLLDKDINLLSVSREDESFHPIFQVDWKEYFYLFTYGNSQARCFQSGLISHFNFPLDLKLVEKACAELIGEFDFQNYFCTGSEVPTTIRSIYECELIPLEKHPTYEQLFGHGYMIRFKGSGFLKQMIRLLMGALWNVGRGQVSMEDFKNSLVQPRNQKLGPVAPADGLYLSNISYKK